MIDLFRHENMGNMCCDPMTALAIASAGLQVVGGIKQGQAAEVQAEGQARQLQAQADADRYNAEIARQNAGIVEGQTQAELDKADRERRIRQGRAIASGGASGVGIESFGDILQSSAAQEELDLLTIKSEGLLRQRDFTTQSTLLESSAANSIGQIGAVKAAGKASKTAAIIGGVSRGLGSLSSMGSSGGAENMSGQGSGYNPSVSAPRRKPIRGSF